jgi:negative regulator of flagellin synthesis FlgM
VTGQTSEPVSGRTPAAAPAAAGGGEAVTVSDAAKFSTDLLESARASDGIDHAAVQQLSTAIQKGTYNVSPDDLAGALINAAKAGRS